MHELWRERWREGRIGFHEGHVNRWLAEYGARLTGRVLVPLCGKTEDLVWLARDHEVVGVEVVEDAVKAFFDEHALVPEVTARGPLQVYRSGPITILCGDLFEVTRDDAGTIDSVYDRAAVIALPEELRQRYVDHLLHLAQRDYRSLTVSLEYDQAKMAGPPFSVTHAELLRRYDGYRFEELGALPDDTRVTPMIERAFWITR